MNKLAKKDIVKIINDYQLYSYDILKKFVIENKNVFSFYDLSLIIELSNQKRNETNAYYTNDFLISYIINYLPNFEGKDTISIIEPSVGAGNFMPYLFEKYKDKKQVSLIVVDIDRDILNLLKIIYSPENIPNNFSINFVVGDFMSLQLKPVDLIVGNPPFAKLSCKEIKNLNGKYSNSTKNLAGFFLEKSLNLADKVSFILPKNLLNTSDYYGIREKITKNHQVEYIIDFGEKGFSGVLIETINLIVSKNKKEFNNIVNIISIPQNIKIAQYSNYIFDNAFPYWIIYRNIDFDNILEKMELGVFNSIRDRQLTNSEIYIRKKSNNDIRVLKSRNISDDGSGIIDIDGYDAYVEYKNLHKYSISKFLDNDTVYLTPNMTYNPRVIKKEKGYIVNGSVAILIPKFNFTLNKKQLSFLSSDTFRKFYKIARNYQTRSLNIDNNSCYWFGIYKE